MSIAAILAERIASVQFDALPEEAVHWARVAVLNTVGCTLAGANEPRARIVGRVIASSGPSLVFGTSRRVARATVSAKLRSVPGCRAFTPPRIPQCRWRAHSTSAPKCG